MKFSTFLMIAIPTCIVLGYGIDATIGAKEFLIMCGLK